MEEEKVVLVDLQDQQLGIMGKMEAHEKAELHRAFSVFILNSNGELLLQQRAREKYHSPGLWTNACCSHQREGESNLEAGINIVDCQETGLAKIGGRLSEIALSLNQVQSPRSNPEDRISSQHRFEKCQAMIRQLALLTYDGTALFSTGPSKPITITIPTKGRWEGLSIDRGDLGQPGLITIDKGKVYGDSPGYLLDSGSIKRACDEWRALCITNRMQWGLLRDRLRGIVKCLLEFDRHRPWKIPELQSGALTGSLRRPNQNN